MATSTALPLPSGAGVTSAPAVVAAGPGDVEEDEFEPQDLDTVSAATTSITSSIYQHQFENGRRYHHYKNGRYPMPNDEEEQNRDDMKHILQMELTDGQLIFSPISANPQRIIDLGTGSGIWALDIADKYPSAEVIGIDLSPIQPAWLPPNLKFLIDDMEDEWLSGDNFDLVHLRHTGAYLKNIDKVLRNGFEHLKPGGWMEVTDFGGYPLSDDNTMPDDYPVKKCFELFREAMRKLHSNTLIANELRPHFEDAGFVNIQCKILKVPLGPWPKDRTLRLVGFYFRRVITDMLAALGNRPFRALGMDPIEIEVFLASVRKSLKDPSIHSYFNFISWYGQKAEIPEKSST